MLSFHISDFSIRIEYIPQKTKAVALPMYGYITKSSRKRGDFWNINGHIVSDGRFLDLHILLLVQSFIPHFRIKSQIENFFRKN